jgi:hypothetical protein
MSLPHFDGFEWRSVEAYSKLNTPRAVFLPVGREHDWFNYMNDSSFLCIQKLMDSHGFTHPILPIMYSHFTAVASGLSPPQAGNQRLRVCADPIPFNVTRNIPKIQSHLEISEPFNCSSWIGVTVLCHAGSSFPRSSISADMCTIGILRNAIQQPINIYKGKR